ncbi:hypothetical protein F5884DRAFT_248604 [Xylogone sp. PMI_703]|nr:hypothetical protein F5884DRAFT_248604 [Xylogone sp. PMI_703]
MQITGLQPQVCFFKIHHCLPTIQQTDLNQSHTNDIISTFVPASQKRAMSGAPGLCTQTELLDKLVQQAEKRIDRYQPAERGKPEDKLSVCLNACMKWFPESGRDSLVHDIVHCANDDELYTVFASIYTGLLSTGKRRVRTESGIASTSAKGSSVMRAIDTANDAFPKSSRRGCDFRHACLQRDDYRCVVTKDMDTKHWQEIGEPDGVAYGNVLAAHIIPFAYALLKEESTLFRYFPAVRRAGNLGAFAAPSKPRIPQMYIISNFTRGILHQTVNYFQTMG